MTRPTSIRLPPPTSRRAFLARIGAAMAGSAVFRGVAAHAAPRHSLDDLERDLRPLLDAPDPAGILPPPSAASPAGPARVLWLQIAHSGEELRVPFWQGGLLLTDGYNQLCYLMRDWRQSRMARMDPSLFHVLWAVQQRVGRGRPLKLMSGYRTRETNEMLRRTSEGVSVNSQHIEARAADIAIDGVSPTEIAEAGARLRLGGVGLYRSFCHLDRGPIRHWGV